jgi:quercetin dioxygenase-like cupin family protein
MVTKNKIQQGMTKTIIIISTCCLFLSCHQNSKPAEVKEVRSSNDSLQTGEANKLDGTEIDFVKSSPGKTKILLENEYVRVIEYTLKPGESDSPHTHPPKTSYVISGGMLRVYPENEKPFDTEAIKGEAEWSGKRGKHFVQNIGKTTVSILLTEIKSAR